MSAVVFRIARRELRGGLAGFRVFLLCLILGVAAIAAVGSVRSSITAGLASEGRALLGGDAELRLTYRRADAPLRAWIGQETARASEVIDFRSMAVTSDDERALTQVKAVDAAWPLVGAAEFEPNMTPAALFAGRAGIPGAAMDPILSARLGLEHGDLFRLGTQEFILMADVLREPDTIGTGFGLGPRTLVPLAALETSGLIGPGSLFDSSYRLVMRDGDALSRLRASLGETLQDGGMRWRDASRAEPSVARFVDRLGAFLILVGLAGLAVGGIGIAAAVRAYLDRKTGVIATLKTLGAEGRTIFAIYFLQIGFLTLVGVTIGVILGALAVQLAVPMLAAQLPVPVVSGVYPAPLIEAAIYGMLTALVFTLWPLARVEQVRAAALYRGIGLDGRATLPRFRLILAQLAALVALIGASVWFSQSWELSLGTAAGITGALVILALSARILRALARFLARTRLTRGNTALRSALAAIGDTREGAVAVVLSLGLGLSVLATVGQIDANLRGAITTELPDRAPSFFLLDIQPGQIEEFNAFLDTREGVSDVQTAPQLRGVISQINGQESARYGDHWVLRGDRGLTYAAEQGDIDLTQGSWWPADYDGPPLISFGADEGQELGLKLGDEITVNVLGRNITGTIANFRELDFRSGGIGFVMTFSPATFRGAPHTFIATLRSSPEIEGALLRELGARFPNVTAVPIRETAERVSEALGSLATATSIAALTTLLTGLVVLIGAAAAGETSRVFEAAILKTLGATRRTILTSFALRSALMGAAAGGVALGAGTLAAWVVLTQVMDLSFRFAPLSAVFIVVGGVVTVLIAGLLFALRPLTARPARILRNRD